LRLFGLALVLQFVAGIAAATTANNQLWVANGPVNTMAANDDVSHLYVNGQFSYTDPGTGVMVINAQTGVFDASFPQVNGPVHAVVSDTAGGWYIGGQFSSVGGTIRHNLAHILWDGVTGWSVDDWHPDPDGTIYALSLSSDAATLYLGGDFSTVIGNTARQYLAAVTTTIPATATTWDPAPDDIVRTLALSADDGTLYTGGDFVHVGAGSVSRHYAAAFDVAELDASNNPNPNYGAVLGWNPDANASVYAMTIAGTTMYLGGSFTELNSGSVQRAYVAAVDLTTADVDAAWNPAPNQIVRAVAVSNGRVYLGGDFSTLNAGTRSQAYLAAVDNATGLIDSGWRPGLDAAVYSLLASPSGELYVGGGFSHVNGQQRNRLATLDLVTATLGDWQPSSWTTVYDLAGSGSNVLAAGGFDRQSRSLLYIGGDFDYVGPATGSAVVIDGSGQVDNSLPQVDGSVYSVVADGAGGWYLGGEFSAVGGVARTNLAHIDSSGSLSSWNPLTDGPVYCLAPAAAGGLYIGGAFSSVNGVGRPYLAEIATTDGSLTSWDPQATGIVRDLVLSGTTLYVGGEFFSSDGMTPSIGNLPRDYVAALNTVTGSAISGWDAVIDGPVYSLALSAASTLYIGGDFFQVNGSVSRPYLAELSTANGTESGWNPQATGIVRDLALSGTTLYVGGDFFSTDGLAASIGNQPRDYVAALSTVDGTALTAWQADADAPVRTLLLAGGLYIGGEFSLIHGISRNRLALLSLSDGQPDPWNPSAGGGVYALAEQGGKVFVGGSFASVGGKKRRNLAALDLLTGQADDWNPAIDGPVNTLLVSGSTVYVGGQFTVAGGQYRQNLAAIDKITGAANAWNPDADGAVYAFRPSGNNVTLFVAGAFALIDGQERHGLAEIGGVNGVATGWAPALDAGARVYALALSGSVLFAGGDFTISALGGTPVLTRNLATFNTAGAALLQWRPAVDGAVRTVLLSPDVTRLYLGGDFNNVDGQARSHVAALDTKAEGAGNYVLAWSADTGGVSDSVRAMALSADRTTLFIGGGFSAIAGGTRAGIAALRVVDDMLLDSWLVTVDDRVDVLLAGQDSIYIGGHFQTVATLPRPHLAAFASLPAETDPPTTTVSLPGGYYTAATLDAIELVCNDGFGSGCATTYYALDDGAWLVYSGPLTLKEDTVLHYFSVDNVGNSEDITANVENYILEITPPETTISPATGVYETETLTVSLACSDSQSGCAATYYTLDDSTPTSASHRYTGPFKIHGKTVVKFFSVDNVGNEEDVQRASFVSSFGGSGQLGLLLLLLPGMVIIVRAFRVGRSGGADA